MNLAQFFDTVVGINPNIPSKNSTIVVSISFSFVSFKLYFSMHYLVMVRRRLQMAVRTSELSCWIRYEVLVCYWRRMGRPCMGYFIRILFRD